MGKVVKVVQKALNARERLWTLGQDYLGFKAVRDGAAVHMAALKDEGLVLLEKIKHDAVKFPLPDGTQIKVQRYPVINSEWNVEGLLKFLRAKVGEKAKPAFKVTVDEDGLKALLDQGLVELKAVQRFVHITRKYGFRVDPLQAAKPESE